VQILDLLIFCPCPASSFGEALVLSHVLSGSTELAEVLSKSVALPRQKPVKHHQTFPRQG